MKKLNVLPFGEIISPLQCRLQWVRVADKNTLALFDGHRSPDDHPSVAADGDLCVHHARMSH